jgi:hypothetical protein
LLNRIYAGLEEADAENQYDGIKQFLAHLTLECILDNPRHPTLSFD